MNPQSRSRIIRSLVALPVFSLLVSVAAAANVTIDCDAGAKIREALIRLKPSDTLLVTGTCKENVVVPAEILRVTLDGQGKAMIDAQPATAAIAITGREVTIKRFTIRGGRNGINVLRGASAMIDGNSIQQTGAAGQPGSGLGINVAQHSFAAIVNNTIQNNPRAGILVHESSSARIGFADVASTGHGNTIQHNGREAILLQRGSTARIVGNTIRGNRGDGIAVEQASHAEIANNLIEENGSNGITVTEHSGVHLEIKATGGAGVTVPNRTAVPNAGWGIQCSVGGYVVGNIGSLIGAKGAKGFDSTCIDRVLIAP
jgi:parallel beta-helix repeat protein